MTSAQGVAPPPPRIRPTSLKPHRYPAWHLAFTVLVIAAVTHSATLIPPYLEAFIGLCRAQAAVTAGNPTAAEAHLLEVLRLVPSSKFARIDIAVLLLADSSGAQQLRVLDYLTGIKLDKYELQRVSAVSSTAAEAHLLGVLRLDPSSKSARIDIAVLLLADPSEAQQLRGLDYLTGIKLDKYEWQRVSAVLPDKFRNAFTSTKR
jgi:hypothetical protein